MTSCVAGAQDRGWTCGAGVNSYYTGLSWGFEVHGAALDFPVMPGHISNNCVMIYYRL